MEKLTSPLIDLSSLQRIHNILDRGHGVLNFPFFSMQFGTADHEYTNVMETGCTQEDITIPPNVRLVVTIQQSPGKYHRYWRQWFCILRCSSHTDPRPDIIHVNIFTDHPYTQTGFTHRQIFCPDFKTDAIRETHRPGDHITPTHLLQNNPENASSLIKSSKPENFKENYCVHTPKNPVGP